MFLKWKDKRDVCVLSTNCSPSEPDVTITRRGVGGAETRVQKPKVITDYNENMGGVDLSDQLRSYYPLARKSRKWYRYIFWFLGDVAITNAYILSNLCRRRPKDSLLEFKMQLAQQLIGGFVGRSDALHRQNFRRSLPAVEAQNVRDHFSIKIVGRKKECVQCKRAGRKTPKGYAKETRDKCAQCDVPLCKLVCFAEYHYNI